MEERPQNDDLNEARGTFGWGIAAVTFWALMFLAAIQ